MILEFLRPLKDKAAFDLPLDISPYAKMMGFHLVRHKGALVTEMHYHSELVGSPFPPALHGGTVASLMEMAAVLQLTWDIDMAQIPKAIDITIDYLRSGKPEKTYARAVVFRKGRRFATLHAEAWQADMDKPIATAVLHFNLAE